MPSHPLHAPSPPPAGARQNRTEFETGAARAFSDTGTGQQVTHALGGPRHPGCHSVPPLLEGSCQIPLSVFFSFCPQVRSFHLTGLEWVGREACLFIQRRWPRVSCFCLKTRLPLVRETTPIPRGKLPWFSRLQLTSLPSGGNTASPKTLSHGPQMGAKLSWESVPLGKVTCWGWCRAHGEGGGPCLLQPRHRGPRASPAPLTWPSRVTQAAGKRYPYLGADLVRRAGTLRCRAAQCIPALLSQPGRDGRAASHILRRDAGSRSPHESPEEGRQSSQALSPISRVSHEMSELGGNTDGQL